MYFSLPKLYTSHCRLPCYTSHSTLFTSHFIIRTLRSTLHALLSTLQTAYSTLRTLHFTLHTQGPMSFVRSTTYSPCSTIHTFHYRTLTLRDSASGSALCTLHFTFDIHNSTLKSRTVRGAFGKIPPGHFTRASQQRVSRQTVVSNVFCESAFLCFTNASRFPRVSCKKMCKRSAWDIVVV